MTAETRSTDEPWDVVCDMEGDVEALYEFGHVLVRLSQSLDDADTDTSRAFYRIADEILTRVKAVQKERGRLFRLLHPERETFEKEGWPGKSQEAA